jgi:Tol biopolymer transport system component
VRKTKTALLATILGTCWTATTLAAGTFTILRLTDQTGCSAAPSSNGSGKLIAFESEADLVGTNADGNFEIFLRDEKKGLTQITNTTGGTNEGASISKSGTRIAFVSDRDHVPGGNADGNSEIFLFDKKKGFRQITNTPSGFSGDARLSASGKRIAFESSADVVPGGNMDASTEIFLFDEKKGFTQITSSTVASDDPSLSGNGGRVAFVSSADLVPGGNMDGNAEIFLFDVKKGLRQITTTTGCFSDTPAANASGKRVAFASTCNLVPPGNVDGSLEIFLFDEKKGFIQITTSPTGGDMFTNASTYPATDAAGKRIAFFSSADLVPPGNDDGNVDLYLFIEKKGLRQLTVSSGGDGIQQAPSMSANGKRITFELNSEIAGSPNADEEGEIYQITEK